MPDLVAHGEPPMVEVRIPEVVLVHLRDARHDDPPEYGILVDPDPPRGPEVGVAHDHDPVDRAAVVIDGHPLGR